MIRALLAMLARVLATPAPAVVDDVDQVDLVPADCEDCGYSIEYCACGYGYDLSDYYDYVVVKR